MKLEQQIEYALQNKITLTQKRKSYAISLNVKSGNKQNSDMLIEEQNVTDITHADTRPHIY